MNYTEIYIDDIQIDLGQDDISIPITYALVDIKNLNNRSGSKSKTIKVPRTELNEKIFGFAFDVNAANGFDKYEPHRIAIYENTELIFSGLCKLIQSTLQSIEFFCYNNLSKFKGISGTKTLQDLNLSDLQHVYDTTIFDTWDNIYPTYVEADYIYPVIDYGQFYSRTLPGTGEVPFINTVDLYPAVRVERLIKQICVDNGYTLVSDFFTDPQFEQLYVPFTNKDFIHSQGYFVETVGFEGYTSDVTPYAVPLSPGEYNIPVITEVFDALNQWDTGTYEYTAASNQRVKINFNGLTQFIGTFNNDIQYEFKIQKYDSATLTWSDILVRSFWKSNGQQQAMSYEISTSLNSGDKIRFVANKLTTTLITQTIAVYVQLAKITPQPVTGLEIQYGEIVQLEPNLPKIKQIDFFKYCYQMFNWVIDVDDDNGVIYIYTFSDYFRLSETDSKDMSDKLTLLPPPVIKYDNLLFNSKYDFQYELDTEDYFLAIQNGIDNAQSNTNFGDGKYYLTEQGDPALIGKVGFSPTVIVRSGNGGSDWIEIPTMISSSEWNNGVPNLNTDHAPRVMFVQRYVSVETLTDGATSGIVTENGSIGTIPFGYFQKRVYNDAGIDDYTQNMSFDINSSASVDLPAVVYSTGTLINRFYADTIKELSVSAQVDAYFNLTPSDVSNIDFSVLWYIDYFNSYFRVNKIIDYLPGRNQPTKVELIKVGTFNNITEDYEPFDN